MRYLAQKARLILHTLLEPKWSQMYKSEPAEICLDSTRLSVSNRLKNLKLAAKAIALDSVDVRKLSHPPGWRTLWRLTSSPSPLFKPQKTIVDKRVNMPRAMRALW